MAETWKGADDLRPLLVPLESLTLDPQNARRHPRRNIEAIKASLERFGQRKPVVHALRTLVAGNGTVLAARELGWREIAAVDAGDLTLEECSAYALADNQTGDLAEWDPDALSRAMRALSPDIKPFTGFAADELSAISAATFGKSEAQAAEAEPEFASIKFTREQYTIIQGAVAKLAEQEGQPDMTPARAVELLCAEFLS